MREYPASLLSTLNVPSRVGVLGVEKVIRENGGRLAGASGPGPNEETAGTTNGEPPPGVACGGGRPAAACGRSAPPWSSRSGSRAASDMTPGELITAVTLPKPIGGAQIYTAFLPHIEKWIITEVPLTVSGADTFMPEGYLDGFKSAGSKKLDEGLVVKYYERR